MNRFRLFWNSPLFRHKKEINRLKKDFFTGRMVLVMNLFKNKTSEDIQRKIDTYLGIPATEEWNQYGLVFTTMKNAVNRHNL